MCPRSVDFFYDNHKLHPASALLSITGSSLACLLSRELVQTICAMVLSTAHTFNSFPDFLADTLRVPTKLRVYHVCTPPTNVKPIFATPEGADEESTTCESHFLTVSQSTAVDQVNTANDSQDALQDPEALVLGIEVLVFETHSTTTIFVSKADSTGLLNRRTPDHASSSIIRTVVSAFIEWLVTQKLSCTSSDSLHGVTEKPQKSEDLDSTTPHEYPHRRAGKPEQKKKLVLSLFARAQNQYLFPGSIENTTNHVLDDRQLIKWWCRLLDSLVHKQWPLHGASTTELGPSSMNGTSAHASHETSGTELAATDQNTAIQPEAYIIVPGCDQADTRRSFTSTTHGSQNGNTTTSKWQNSFPVEHLSCQELIKSDTTSLPVRYLIPRLPDDPKARFCDDLDDAGIDDRGQWRTVKSLPQFWEMMEYRQECAAGRLVGFMWVVFDLSRKDQVHIDGSLHEDVLALTENGVRACENGYVENTDVHLPRESPAYATLTSEQYINISDLLINDTDFAGRECAIKSTCQWIAKVKELAGIHDFGVEIEGQAIASSDSSTAVSVTPNSRGKNGGHVNSGSENIRPASANMLVGVKRKKRADVALEESEHASTISPTDEILETVDKTANDKNITESATLDSSLIRKKPKLG